MVPCPYQDTPPRALIPTTACSRTRRYVYHPLYAHHSLLVQLLAASFPKFYFLINALRYVFFFSCARPAFDRSPNSVKSKMGLGTLPNSRI
jgi:hypothetical protein